MKKDPSSPMRLAVLMAMVAAWPAPALCAGGVVQFTAGDVSLRRADVTAPLAKGAELDTGDVVLTGPAGRAQIRFSDGGLVALYPDSQFTVSRYLDGAGAGEDSFVVQLVRGGLRAVTGLIGKRNPDRYKVITPTAVVGIRGSAFLVVITPDGKVLVSGEQEHIEVCTEGGCVGVAAGEAVLVTSPRERPVYTNTRALLPVPPLQTPLAAGEQLNTEGRRSNVFSVQPPPPPAPTPAPAPVIPVTPIPPAPAPAPDPFVPPPPVTGTPPPTGNPQNPTAPPVTGTPPPPVVAPTPAPRPPFIFLPVLPPIFFAPPPPPPPPVLR